MYNTRRLYKRAIHPPRTTSLPAPLEHFFKLNGPCKLYCELQTMPNLQCLLRSSIQLFCCAVGALEFNSTGPT